MNNLFKIISISALTIALVASCKKGSDPKPPDSEPTVQKSKNYKIETEEKLDLTKVELDLGKVETEKKSYKYVVFTGTTSDSTIFIDSTRVTDGDTNDFRCNAGSFSFNDKVKGSVKVFFEPKSEGQKQATITIYSKKSGNSTFKAKGEGYTPKLKPSKEKISFLHCEHSSRNCKTTPNLVAVSFKNISSELITIESIKLEKSTRFFRLKQITDGKINYVHELTHIKEVKAGEQFSITVNFNFDLKYRDMKKFEDKIIIKTNVGTFTVELEGIYRFS